MLDINGDLRTIMLITIGCGVAGGILFELLLSRRGGSGYIEMPAGKLLRGRLWDSGFIGSVLLGAGAAVAFMLVYRPIEVTDAGGATTEGYPKIELICMSLVAGAAGSSILGALTATATRLATAAKLETIIEGLKQLKEQVPTTAEGSPGLTSQIDTLIAQAENAVHEPRN